ncbi:hypothetical protein AAG906_029360 [Vitis piasezkii]
MKIVGVCPHHGFNKWMLVSYFYEGMSSQMKQILNTIDKGVNRAKANGVYALSNGLDFQAKIATLTRRLDNLEAKEAQEVRNVNEEVMQGCLICKSMEHYVTIMTSFNNKEIGINMTKVMDNKYLHLKGYHLKVFNNKDKFYHLYQA